MSGKTTSEPTFKDKAFELLDSMRGRYILSQALHYGIQELERVPVPYQETSNLQDMTLLRQELFNFPIEDNSNAIAMAKEEGLIE
tara:strand:- start:1503 stop:1757 length:255 start_codon:yes stop_codon:yes gene_type:complete